ncbi:MAG TPA: hypothetical protein VNB65_02520 [Gaiellaceae bacterium]|nr:hypothetical protein [Gaiellaceae bacterium]
MLRLYWANNDGMSGHVFLDPADVELLRQEMVLQGVMLPALEPGARIPAEDVQAAVASAEEDPISVTDSKLWRDWLAFLEGAAENGGLVVQ